MLTVRQVAERLQLAEWTVRRYLREGRIASHRLGTRRRVSEADLGAFLKRQREPSKKAKKKRSRR